MADVCITKPNYPPVVVDSKGIPLNTWTHQRTLNNSEVYHPLTIGNIVKDYIEYGSCANETEIIKVAESIVKMYVDNEG